MAVQVATSQPETRWPSAWHVIGSEHNTHELWPADKKQSDPVEQS